jgi:hypothetical protein
MVIMAPMMARGKDERQRYPEDAQEPGHHLRLLQIVSGLPFHLLRETGVRLDPFLEELELRGVVHPQDHRGEDGAPEGGHELFHVAPDLGGETSIARVEDTNDSPLPHPEAQLPSQVGVLETLRDA